MHVYLDTDTDDQRNIPLECISVRREKWNGFEVPLAAAWQVDQFVRARRAADPNGTWGEVYTRVSDGALVVTRNDSADPDDWDIWPGLPGTRYYALDGWTWIKGEEAQ